MPTQKPPRIPLPKGWPSHVQSGLLPLIALAHVALTRARGGAAKSVRARVRIAAEKDRLHQEFALLREELRLKDARMSVVAPPRRPRSAPTERRAMLAVRAARGWSLQPTADLFLLAPATVGLWAQRVKKTSW